LYADADVWKEFNIVVSWEIGYPTAADVIARFDHDKGTLTISGKGEMKDWSSPEDRPWHDVEKDITNIIIMSGVTTIGDCAFYDFYYLSSINIPDGITKIGNAAFNSCCKLPSINIPESVENIGEGAFAWFNSCDNGLSDLTDITVHWETPLEIDGSVFAGLVLLNVNLHVPEGTQCAYTEADVWKYFNIELKCLIPPPANDHCIDAIPIYCGTEVNGTLRGATPSTSLYDDGNDRNDVFYQFTAEITGFYTITLTKSNLEDDINLYVYSDCSTTTTFVKLIDAEDDLIETKSEYFTEGTYLIRAIDWNYKGGDFKILVVCPTQKFEDICLSNIEVNPNSRLVPTFSPNRYDYQIFFECNHDDVDVRFTTIHPSTIIYVDDVKLDESRLKNFEKGVPGTKTAKVRIEDGNYWCEYTLELIRPFNRAVIPVWHDVLSVINNPDNNDGFTFKEYKWYYDKDMVHFTGVIDAYIQVGDNTDLNYTVELVTSDDTKSYGCRQLPEQKSSSVKVWPNPATGRMMVEIEDHSGEFLMELRNMQGTLLQKKIFSQSQFEMNLSELPPGVYLLSVDGTTVRIVKEYLRIKKNVIFLNESYA